jgi:hypothetical protein
MLKIRRLSMSVHPRRPIRVSPGVRCQKIWFSVPETSSSLIEGMRMVREPSPAGSPGIVAGTMMETGPGRIPILHHRATEDTEERIRGKHRRIEISIPRGFRDMAVVTAVEVGFLVLLCTTDLEDLVRRARIPNPFAGSDFR